VPETRSRGSCGVFVLVDEAVAAREPGDVRRGERERRVRGYRRGRRLLLKCPVRPVAVVVVDVLGDEPLQLALVLDDGAVEQFATQASDPPLCEGVGHRCPHGDGEDLDALGAEHVVEGRGELAAAVAHERLGVRELLAVAEEEVACGLDGPGCGRVDGDPGVPAVGVGQLGAGDLAAQDGQLVPQHDNLQFLGTAGPCHGPCSPASRFLLRPGFPVIHGLLDQGS